MPLTRQQRAHRIATAELADIDRDLQLLTEDRARHARCGSCRRWRNDSQMIDGLLTLRLEVTDFRDIEALQW